MVFVEGSGLVKGLPGIGDATAVPEGAQPDCHSERSCSGTGLCKRWAGRPETVTSIHLLLPGLLPLHPPGLFADRAVPSLSPGS